MRATARVDPGAASTAKAVAAQRVYYTNRRHLSWLALMARLGRCHCGQACLTLHAVHTLLFSQHTRRRVGPGGLGVAEVCEPSLRKRTLVACGYP